MLINMHHIIYKSFSNTYYILTEFLKPLPIPPFMPSKPKCGIDTTKRVNLLQHFVAHIIEPNYEEINISGSLVRIRSYFPIHRLLLLETWMHLISLKIKFYIVSFNQKGFYDICTMAKVNHLPEIYTWLCT